VKQVFDNNLNKNIEINNIPDKVVISKINSSLVGLSKIDDYIFQPTIMIM